MSHNPADRIQDLQNFGEFGGVNPSIADSSTFTYLKASTSCKEIKKDVTCILDTPIPAQVIFPKL